MPTKKKLVLHPLFFVVYPLLFLYSHNIKEVAFKNVLSPLILVGAISALVWLLLIPCIRDIGRRAVFFSTLALTFFSYGHIHRLLFDKHAQPWFSISYLLATLILLYALLKSKKRFQKTNSIMNLISIVLVVFSLAQIVFYEISFRKGSLLDLEKYQIQLKADPQKGKAGPTPPDIYFLLFDRYGSSEILADHFHYDNRYFDNFLREKGFYLGSKSKANYPYTFLSLAATFNLQYLNFLYQVTGKTNDRTIVYNLIQEASLVKFLKSRGYQYYLLGSWWQPSRRSKYADQNIYLANIKLFNLALNEFSENLFKTTFLYHFIVNILDTQLVESVADPQKILHQFDQLLKIPSIKGPKFVFAHILSTHPPFFFNHDGTLTTPDSRRSGDKKDLYLNTITFTNKKIKQVVEAIIAKSATPPIILLQADEGPYGTIIKSRYKWRNPYRRLKLQSSILNAMYLPGLPREQLYPRISPVNTFRLILNHYFGTDLELLKDEVYISDHKQNLYKFINITKKVAYGSLNVVTKPAGAAIYIDDQDTGLQSNHKFWYMEPGIHTVKISKSGFKDFHSTILIKATRVTRIKIKLHPKSIVK